jgi:hypothetical protein
VQSIGTAPAFVASRFRSALAAPTVRCIEPPHALQEPIMPTSQLPARFTSLLLAALVTAGLLGSMNLLAGEQVAMARSALQASSTNAHPAGQAASNCVQG